MGIDAESVRFAAALAQVEARAKSDADAKRKAEADAKRKAEADAEAKRKAQAEAEAEAERKAAETDGEADAQRSAQAEGEADAERKADADAELESHQSTEAAAPAEKPVQEPEAHSAGASDADAASGEAAPKASASETEASEASASESVAGANEASHNEAAPSRASLGEAETEPQIAASPDRPAGQDAAGNGAAPAASTPPSAAANPGPSPATPASQAPRSISPERGTPAAARAAAHASKRGLAHTMLGLSDEVIKSASSAPPPSAGSSIPPAREARDALPRGITPTPLASGKPGSSSSLPPKAAAKGTLLGIQSGAQRFDQTQIEGEQLFDAGAQTADGGGSSPELSSTRVEGSSRGTALGLGSPQTPPKRSAPQGRTMLGVPVASISPPNTNTTSSSNIAARSSSTSIPPERIAEDSSDRGSSLPPSVPGRSSARSRNVMILGSLALLSIIVMVYVRLSSTSNNADVSARIMTGPDGETLLFEVPEAREGSSIRFGGQEQPLVSGKATFALASDSLRVGENVVLADVVTPDGETSSARIVLSVFYRIWVDTANLRVDKPTVDVLVTAVPGTKVTLEGVDVPLDNQGKATKTYPIDIRRPGKGGVIEHVVHYRMQPPQGETVVDELHTRIAVAMMQIDRPGPDIVTDRESVEIAGAVGRDTQVDVDGSAVPVKDGRFVHTLALPKPGDYRPRVTAKSAGKIPYASTLNIKRVRDLAQAAREFQFNKDLNYAKLSVSPTLYRGQSIAIEGRIYATVPRAGSSVIQMLARPCPTAQRCSVWIVDPQGTEVAVDRFIRVLGTVDGEQQFRSEKNEIVTVPKIIARFVLPAKP